ncbi:hypothetical protein HDV57DRAFT_492007 [Trichoderma longibrachiatum]
MNQLSKAEDPDVVCLQLVSSLVRDEDAASAVLISMLGLVRIIHRNLVRIIRRNIHLRSRLGPNGPGASMSAWRIPRRFHRASAAPAKQKNSRTGGFPCPLSLESAVISPLGSLACSLDMEWLPNLTTTAERLF